MGPRDAANATCREPIRPPSEIVVLVGLPGAGKTSFARASFPGFDYVSKDQWPNARNRHARELRVIDHALAAGRKVIVDDTNPSAADRAPLIALARHHGARVVAYQIDATTRECVARNARREGRARVPNVAIFAKAAKMEPPTLAEGFDAIYRVRLEQGGFAIEWPECDASDPSTR